MVQLNDPPEGLAIVAETDVVRDEGESYVMKLVQAGVSATSTRYSVAIHDFVMLSALAEAQPHVTPFRRPLRSLEQRSMADSMPRNKVQTADH